VTGRLGDIREKYLVEIATLLMVTLSFSVLVAETSIVLVVPAATLPKFRLALPKARLPVGGGRFDPPALTPWQPTRIARLRTSRNAPTAFPTLVWTGGRLIPISLVGKAALR